MRAEESVRVPCPACGAEVARRIVQTVNASRDPELVDEIVARRFQVATCKSCGNAHDICFPVAYLDFEREHWITAYPLSWEPDWRSCEPQTQQAFRSAMIDDAPPHMSAAAARFVIQTVFGLDGLADKVVALRAGLDDAALELAKLALARSLNLDLSPMGRPRLMEVDGDTLKFRVLTSSSAEPGDAPPGGTPGARRVSAVAGLPRADVQRAPELMPLIERLERTTWVDVGALLYGGQTVDGSA